MTFLRRSLLVVLSQVILTAAYHSESVRQKFPLLVDAQLYFHHVLTWFNPHSPRVERVVLAEVDDATFWHAPFSGIQPTNRRSLADLALRIANAGASVIALDFQIKSPDPSRVGDDPVRGSDNTHLLDVIRTITKKGIPVVLTCGLEGNAQGEWQRQPNIFADDLLPLGTLVGHINLPLDHRHIPLQMRAREWDGHVIRDYDSFALKIVAAYESATHIKPETSQNPIISTAAQNREFVFGTFIRMSAFPRVSAGRLLRGSEGDLDLCRGRVVIVGGTWHSRAQNQGPLVEEFLSPIGTVPGLYLHANYVEALLADRLAAPLSTALAVILDLVLAVILYYLFQRLRWKLLLLAFFFVPLFLAYILLTNLGIYLDFILPFTLCLVHLLFELLFKHGAAYRQQGGRVAGEQ